MEQQRNRVRERAFSHIFHSLKLLLQPTCTHCIFYCSKILTFPFSNYILSSLVNRRNNFHESSKPICNLYKTTHGLTCNICKEQWALFTPTRPLFSRAVGESLVGGVIWETIPAKWQPSCCVFYLAGKSCWNMLVFGLTWTHDCKNSVVEADKFSFSTPFFQQTAHR